MSTVAPLLSLSGVSKRFGETIAVDDVTFTLRAGAATALIGESGSGKTTTARMIVGLEEPTAGTIAVDGRDRSRPTRDRAELRRRGREVQLVFQDPYTSLDPRQSASACLREMLRHYKPELSEDALAREVAELIDVVGLDDRQAAALPARLSGGQRQRVAIARALAPDPRLLVLDEAVSALDVSLQAQVLNVLADLRSLRSVALLLITHDLAVADQVAQEGLVMRRGEIVERGTMTQLLQEPEHEYTRRLRDSIPRPG